MVLFVATVLAGVFWMDRTFRGRADGAVPILAWIAVVALGLLLALGLGGVGALAWCG